MALDMNTHGKEIRKAVDGVASDSGNDWCIIGYEGKTHTLFVHGEGDGGLDEMVDEFHGSKIMYGYVRVKEPNTGLPKFVFINWQGEGAPERMKFNCSSHSADVQRLCRPIHVTVNARDESDLDTSEIVNKVVKASGSQFSVLKSANNVPDVKPVIAQKPKGAVYQKANPTAEILNRERDAYWQKLEREEAQQRQEESRKKKEERAKEERERKARDEREAQERERRTAERARQIAVQRNQEQRTASNTAPAAQGAADDVEADERERRSRSESIKNERQAELQALVAARSAAGLQPSQKVSSSYKKVDPRAELASLQRDQYWNKLEEEEKRRREEDSKRTTSEAAQREQQRIAREEADAKRREATERERAQAIAQQRSAEQRRAADEDRRKIEALARAQHREATEDEEERSSRSDRLRKERQEEAQRLIGQRGAASALRARFQDGGVGQQPPPQPAAPVQPHYEQPPQPQYEPPPQPQAPAQPQYEPPPQPQAPAQPQYEPPPQPQYEPPPQPQYEPPPQQQYEPPPQQQYESALAPAAHTDENTGWTAAQEAAYEPADNGGYGAAEDLQQETSPEEDHQGLYQEPPPQPEHEEPSQQEYQEPPQPDYQEPPESDYQEPPQQEYQEPPQQEEYEAAGQDYDQGTCAEAIYDYTAAEGDEISFNPGDIIRHIEQIDEGWWSGIAADGHRGLFPSNYVRLLI